MNNKVEIWKRKLAKNKLKQQMEMWERLTYVKEENLFADMEFKINSTTVNANGRKLSAGWTITDELGDE